ncbi:MAG: DUF4418 family protein [Dorea sp.]|nr:DUF4418 family protein [Dorea sp.]
MDKRIKRIINAAVLLIGLLSVGAAKIWAPACKGLLKLADRSTIPMKCTYTEKAWAFIGVLILILAVENMLQNRLTGFAYIAIGVSMIVITISGIGIGVCAKEGMACAATSLWMRALGSCMCICGIGALLVKGEKNI